MRICRKSHVATAMAAQPLRWLELTRLPRLWGDVLVPTLAEALEACCKM